MSAYTHKVVNGVAIPLSPEEIAEAQARDAEFTAQEPHRQAERQRYDDLTKDEAALQMADRLANMTTAQIDNWFANNVTNAATAISVLKTICKILAVKLTPRGLGA